MTTIVRTATRADIPAMHRIRLAVHENPLTSTVLEEADYIEEMEVHGRGWVAQAQDEVVGFAVGNAVTGNIWALFVDPVHERLGHGRRLHDVMVAWLFARGLERLRLSTTPRTRAQGFYERAGWRFKEMLPSGEALYEMTRQDAAQ